MKNNFFWRSAFGGRLSAFSPMSVSSQTFLWPVETQVMGVGRMRYVPTLTTNDFRLTTKFVILLLSLITHHSYGQRIELPVLNEGYHTVSLGNKGVVLVNQQNRNSFSIQKFDTDFRLNWNVSGTLEDNLQFVKSSYDGESVYLLFSRQKADYYQVAKVNITLGFLETFYLSAVDRFEITDFQTLGYAVFMAGSIRNEPALIYTNLATKNSKILPGVNQPNTVIQSVEVDTAQRLVNVCYALKRNREVKLACKSFDEKGQLTSQFVVEPDDDYSLLSGRVFVMNDSTKLVIGTYGFRNMQSNSGSASQGLFLSKVIHDEVTFTQYHSFTDFENFFNFMSERSKERIEKRIERKKDNGGELKLNYRLLVHDIIPQGDNYLISAEVFYPEYRNNNYGPYGSPFYGSSLYSPYMYTPYSWYIFNPYAWDPFYVRNRNGQIFNGFVYTHAIVASFDANGKRLWDNCLPFDNVKSMELKEKMKLAVNSDQTVSMFYSDKGAIKAKVFAQNRVLTDMNPINISTDDAADRVRQTTTDDVVHWYANFYLATGYQKITGSEGRRNVFYLNKVSY